MKLRPEEVKSDWRQRQKDHGNSPKSVLMKGVHQCINQTIDAWHRHVLRRTLPKVVETSEEFALDVGCGYGRLTNEINERGYLPVGLDFTLEFCKGFSKNYHRAVCADLSAMPFQQESMQCAYSVTSLMYLDYPMAKLALEQIDRCLKIGGTILILEPSLEFNRIVRFFLPKKGIERLAMPGFTSNQFYADLPPENWSRIETGTNLFMTLLFPLLILFSRWPRGYRVLSNFVLSLDNSKYGTNWLGRWISMYRWTSYRKDA